MQFKSDPPPSASQWALIGGGQMGRALASGMIASQVTKPANLMLVDPDAQSRQWWTENQPDVLQKSQTDAVSQCDIVMLAVKPHIVPMVFGDDLSIWKDKLVVSIAAGVSLEKLAAMAGHDRVIRVMPNTPSMIGRGASGFCCGQHVGEQDRDQVAKVMESVGIAVEVAENQMDAVTGLSGSGPAYVYVLIEALADGGVLAGLPRPLAMKLAIQTVIGAAEMVQKTGQHPGALKDAVASPAGTTIAGLQAMENGGARAAMIAAVQASASRSRDLG